jgi:hypothetical protein
VDQAGVAVHGNGQQRRCHQGVKFHFVFAFYLKFYFIPDSIRDGY